MERINVIIEEFKNNNYDSFDEFYNLTSRILYVVIHDIVKSRSDTEDLMQETYLKFIEMTKKKFDSKYPQAYLIMIGKNKAINFYNHKKREILDEDFINTVKEVKEEPRVDFSILDLLKDNEKEIVKLHLQGDLTFKEIAIIVEKPLGTVLWIYNKAIKYLQKEVNKNEEN